MMRLRFVTPERILVDEEVSSVTLPTDQGEITILSEHMPLIALLKPGITRYTNNAQETEEVAVSEGFVQVRKDNRVHVLTETAERGHELDMSVIEGATTRAKQVMSQAARQDDLTFATAAAALERELARSRLVQKMRRRI